MEPKRNRDKGGLESGHARNKVAGGVYNNQYFHLPLVSLGGEQAVAEHHRVSPRKHPSLQVVINYGADHSESHLIRDLSMNGLFMEMTAVDLREGDQLEVVLRIKQADKTAIHRIPAKASRVAPDGVAIIFNKYDDDAYTDLVNLLYAM